MNRSPMAGGGALSAILRARFGRGGGGMESAAASHGSVPKRGRVANGALPRSDPAPEATGAIRNGGTGSLHLHRAEPARLPPAELRGDRGNRHSGSRPRLYASAGSVAERAARRQWLNQWPRYAA